MQSTAVYTGKKVEGAASSRQVRRYECGMGMKRTRSLARMPLPLLAAPVIATPVDARIPKSTRNGKTRREPE